MYSTVNPYMSPRTDQDRRSNQDRKSNHTSGSRRSAYRSQRSHDQDAAVPHSSATRMDTYRVVDSKDDPHVCVTTKLHGVRHPTNSYPLSDTGRDNAGRILFLVNLYGSLAVAIENIRVELKTKISTSSLDDTINGPHRVVKEFVKEHPAYLEYPDPEEDIIGADTHGLDDLIVRLLLLRLYHLTGY
jgi:hypothetical protein